MVERDEVTTLRDYDKQTLSKKLDEIYFDQSANDNLLRRSLINDRLEYDRKRWSQVKWQV
jgi:hypothetical protein